MAVVKQTLTPTTKFPLIPMQTKQKIKKTEDLDLSTHPVRPVVEQITSESNVTLEPTQRTDRLPVKDDPKDKTKSSRQRLKATRAGMPKLQPKF